MRLSAAQFLFVTLWLAAVPGSTALGTSAEAANENIRKRAGMALNPPTDRDALVRWCIRTLNRTLGKDNIRLRWGEIEYCQQNGGKKY